MKENGYCNTASQESGQALKMGNLVGWAVTELILVILRSETYFGGRY